jgi:inhibitor of KinA
MVSMTPSIEPLGDSAAIVAWRLLDEAAAWRAVQNATEYLDRNRIDGVVAVAPAFKSLTVYYECSKLAWSEAERWISDSLNSFPISPETMRRQLDIPVCYAPEFALDLTAVATAHNLNRDVVIQLHSDANYVVQMIGFSPGFPYLAGLPAELHMPRLASPRIHVPAGSVAIGGAQTGIYSCHTPGGWNIIGRTPVRLFDPLRDPACLLRPGDAVRFVPIDRQQFEDYVERP